MLLIMQILIMARIGSVNVNLTFERLKTRRNVLQPLVISFKYESKVTVEKFPLMKPIWLMELQLRSDSELQLLAILHIDFSNLVLQWIHNYFLTASI